MIATRRRTALLLTAVLTGLILIAILVIVGRSGTEHWTVLKAGSERYQVELSLGERRTGVIDAELVVRDAAGRPAELTGVTLAGVMPTMGHAMSELTTTPDGPGRYRARGELFTMTGQWEVVIRLTGRDEITVPVTVTR